MSVLHFMKVGQSLATVEACPGDVLIDVARFHEVPLHWRCGQGTCGTCVVQISHAGQPAVVKVGRKERNVMLRAGLISSVQAQQEDWPDAPQTPRLACHLMLDEHDWLVALPPD